jgi:hypothetical protein
VGVHKAEVVGEKCGFTPVRDALHSIGRFRRFAVTVDRQLIEAKLAFNLIASGDMPSIASQIR